MQMYPSCGGYKEQYYTVVEEVDYIVKDDYHYNNKGSNMQMMMKPATNHGYNNQIHGYDDHNKHAHQSYGEYDLHNKNGHNKGYGGYDDHNKHAHQSYGGYDLHNKNGHNKGYGGYDDHNKRMHEGYGGYDQNKHGYGGYGGAHDNRNKYGGEGCNAAKYSETWYEKEKRNGNDDWNMKSKQHIGSNDHHNVVGFTDGGYWANQGPPVPRCPVWQSKGIDD